MSLTPRPTAAVPAGTPAGTTAGTPGATAAARPAARHGPTAQAEAGTARRRRFLLGLGALAAGAGPAAVLAAPGPPAPGAHTVRIGYAICRTGAFAPPAQTTQEPTYILWAEQVNAAGGLDVQGRRMAVELIGLDDQSDPERSVQAYLHLMTQQKVDLILAPWGTRMTSAVAPLANRFGYPLLAPTATSRRLTDMNLSYYFSALQQGYTMMAALAGLLQAHGAKTLALLHREDGFGMEHLESLHLNLRGTQLQVALQRSHTDRRTDPASDLAACMTLQPDTLVALSYPAETVRFTEQARRVGFNPRFFYAAVGTAYPSFAQHFGAAAHGTLGMASWNRKSGAGAQAYFDAHVRRFGREPDRWASGHTYAALQVLQAAVQQAGLDRKDIRAFIANRGADTILGPMHFRRGELASIPGMVGQWQNGEFEVVWPPERATAPLLAPKPRWPAA